MNCRITRRRLVAWLDGELAPAEAAQVDEHLDRCPACAERAEHLATWTPEAPVVHLDAAARHAMHLQVDAALDAAWTEPTPATRPARNDLLEPLRGEIALPRALVALYAAALLLAVGFAASQALAPPAAGPTGPAAQAPAPPTETAARATESARPAAYTPEEGWF